MLQPADTTKIDWDDFKDTLYSKLWFFSKHYVDTKTLLLVHELFGAWQNEEDWAEGCIDMQFVAPWLFFEWQYSPSALQGLPNTYDTISEFSRSTDSSLSLLEKEFLIQAEKSPFSFYQVIAKKKTGFLEIENLLTDQRIHLVDAFLSDCIFKGDIIFAKCIELQNIGIIVGSAPTIFDKKDRNTILEFKYGLLEHFESIDEDILSLYRGDLLLVYDDLAEDKLNVS